MPCLVVLPPTIQPGRRRPSTSVSRRGRTLAALPCRCRCGRRGLIGASSAAALLPILSPPFTASPPIDPEVMLERVHPSRPDWYEEFYATAMDQGMKSYEAEIAGYKAKLFSQLSATGKNILEPGVGTGPNFKYYASDNGVIVTGVDPNKHMEDYARRAAVSAGLPSSCFTFKRGVAEALPADDNSMDVVIGTLVLCSVNNIDMALREIYRVLKPGGLYLFVEHVAAPDGSLLRFVQGAFDPLQQFVADGCHLTRKTGENIRGVGFSSLSLDSVRLSNAYIISPHIYGVACK
nr:methyltransferase-like protein 7A-like protein 1 [Echinochloa crus-galli var. crus-galli]